MAFAWKLKQYEFMELINEVTGQVIRLSWSSHTGRYVKVHIEADQSIRIARPKVSDECEKAMGEDR